MISRLNPQERIRLAQSLRKRADTDPNLSAERRQELLRHAWNLMKINEAIAKRQSDDPALRHDELRRIFNKASAPFPEHVRHQLAHRHMIGLADVFEGWALDKRLTPEQSVQLVGWAESMRALADEVGPDWDPPKPKKLTLMGFLGRKALDE
jgi:hypothetical protein